MEEKTDHAKKEKLGEILLRTGMIAPERLQEALQIAAAENKLIGQVLVQHEMLTARDLVTALSIQLKVPLIDLRRHKVNQHALSLVPEKLARKYNIDLADGYIDACHMCFLVRKALIDKFPELLCPRQVYGLE